MAVFKFKILIDELTDVVREVEVKPSQTFKDLHDGIVKYFELRKGNDASFFTSNARWKKISEIPIGHEGVGDSEVTETSTIDTLVPGKTKWLMYFTEANPQLNFLIELVKEDEEKVGRKYPFCTKTVGQISTVGGFGNEVFEDELGISFDDEFDDYVDDPY